MIRPMSAASYCFLIRTLVVISWDPSTPSGVRNANILKYAKNGIFHGFSYFFLLNSIKSSLFNQKKVRATMYYSLCFFFAADPLSSNFCFFCVTRVVR
jgi:hypothetical protein